MSLINGQDVKLGSGDDNYGGKNIIIKASSIKLGAGNDKLVAKDIISSSISLGDGDDLLEIKSLSNQGWSSISGGKGKDTLVLPGNFSDYSFQANDHINDTKLVYFEVYKFADKIIDLTLYNSETLTNYQDSLDGNDFSGNNLDFTSKDKTTWISDAINGVIKLWDNKNIDSTTWKSAGLDNFVFTELKNSTISTGAGNDKLKAYKADNISIKLGDGDDSLEIQSLKDSISKGGLGNDTIALSGNKDDYKLNKEFDTSGDEYISIKYDGKADMGFSYYNTKLYEFESIKFANSTHLISDLLPSAPTNLSLTSSGIKENSPAGSVIGTLAATDPDASSTFTYALVPFLGLPVPSPDADNALVEIVGNQIKVKSGANIDFETNPVLNLNIQVTDNTGLTFTKAVSTPVLDVAEAPTNLALISSGIKENSPAGTVIGTLEAADPDFSKYGDFTHTLVPGEDGVDADNNLVMIIGQKVLVKPGAKIDFETNPVLNLNIKVTDNTGLTFTKAVSTSVLDEWENSDILLPVIKSPIIPLPPILPPNILPKVGTNPPNDVYKGLTPSEIVDKFLSDLKKYADYHGGKYSLGLDFSWENIDLGSASSSVLKTIEWSKINTKYLSSETLKKLDWSSVNTLTFSAETYSQLDWSTVKVGAFSQESKKTLDWQKVKIGGDNGASTESLSTTDLFQYNAANGKAVVDYKKTNLNQFKFGEFSETSYEAINWSKVNFKGITAETYSQMDFSEVITSKGFSAATYKSVDWSKVDYGDFKAETYQKTDWSKVSFGKLSSSSYTAMDWSQVVTSTGFKAATYKAVNWGLVDFGDYKAESYKKTDWSKVNFKQFSASSYSSIDWSQVITASGFNAAAYKSVNWGKVDFGDFKQQTFASTKWNQVNFKQLSTSQYQAINWNEINLGALSTKTYKAIDWKKVNVAAFDADSISTAKWGLMKGVTKPTAAAKPAEADLSFLGVTAPAGTTAGLIGAAGQSSSNQVVAALTAAQKPAFL